MTPEEFELLDALLRDSVELEQDPDQLVAVNVALALPGERGPKGEDGTPGTNGNLAQAIYPGRGTYPAASLTNTLDSIIDRKVEDDIASLVLLFENALV